MLWSVVLLLISLALILASCEIFTNGVEWAGKKLNLSEGAVGSVLSAVGTALPETMIPIVAILFASGTSSHEVGIGAIAGAPFMLSTLTMFITGIAIISYASFNKRDVAMQIDNEVILRDMGTFLIVYTVAIAASFIHSYPIRMIISIALVLSYLYYLYKTLQEEGQEEQELEPLHACKIFNVKNTLPVIFLQLGVALFGIVWGAHLFVKHTEHISTLLNISPLILSMIITPVATELPEKFNSVIWVGKQKDTLALGNITGAMVFQSCFPVALGIAFTPWNLTGPTLVSAFIAIISIFMNYVLLKFRRKMSAYTLLLGGGFYLSFLVYVFRFI